MNQSDIEIILQEHARTHLSPTDLERAEISRRYNQLKSFLKDSTFQNGSYARHTSTTPVNDLDVIYELPEEIYESVKIAKAAIDPYRLDINNILSSLAKELKEFYGSSVTVKLQPHSVGIYFGGDDDFSIDVVPAMTADNGKYWVPETSHLSVKKRRQLYESTSGSLSFDWIKSDPKGYINQAKQLDEVTTGRLRKSAKIIKRWRWRWKQVFKEFPIKSFHLEMIVTDMHLSNSSISCFDVLRTTIDNLSLIVAEPRFPDKADSSRFIDSYVVDLTDSQKALLDSALETSQKEIESILSNLESDRVETALLSFFGKSQQTSLLSKLNESVAGFVGSTKKFVLRGIKPIYGREAGEQFLSDYGISENLIYDLKINATISQDGFRPFKLIGSLFPLKKKRDVEFYVESCNVPQPYQIKWKVKNTGAEAQRVGQLRGEIYDDDGHQRRKESTKYLGNHYVECYAIKDGVCVAGDQIPVDISSIE